jgi:hypothetical protein
VGWKNLCKTKRPRLFVGVFENLDLNREHYRQTNTEGLNGLRERFRTKNFRQKLRLRSFLFRINAANLFIYS